MRYVSAKEAKKFFEISGQTLKMWKDKGLINFKQFSPKKILYDIDSLNKTNSQENIDTRQHVIYARVSCSNQKQSLENQIELIKQYMISNGIKVDEIYSEIASGLNEDRKELNRLIRDVQSDKISKVYISFKDRLTRFGFNYFKNIFSNSNVEIVILDENEETNKDYKTELVEDLISIIHHYSTKLYSNRRKELKEIEKIIKETEINNI